MRKVLKEGGLGICFGFCFSPNLSQGCDPIYEKLNLSDFAPTEHV